MNQLAVPLGVGTTANPVRRQFSRWRSPALCAAPLDLTPANLRQALLAGYERDPLGTHARVYNLAEALWARYPDYHTYAYYHLLVGSTPCSVVRWDDLPGGEIGQFLCELAASVQGGP